MLCGGLASCCSGTKVQTRRQGWRVGFGGGAGNHKENAHTTEAVEEQSHGTKRRGLLGLFKKHEPTEPPCLAPRPGEKVIYWIRHCHPHADYGFDANLTILGVKMAERLTASPLLAAATSLDPQFRAQKILVSPFRRALQTALHGFGKAFKNDSQWELNLDISEMQVADRVVPEHGIDTLHRMNATHLLRQYEAVAPTMDDALRDHKKRWDHFLKVLKARPEERFIAISHHFQVKNVGLYLGYGEVGISAFNPDTEEWRILDPPQCWPEFKDTWNKIVEYYTQLGKTQNLTAASFTGHA